MLSPGTRVPLSRVLGGEEDLHDDDGELSVVRFQRIVRARLRAWWRAGGSLALGMAILLLARNVNDGSVATWLTVLVVIIVAGAIVGQLRMRLHPAGGFRRLCYVEARRDAIGGGVLTTSSSAKGVASLVVLPAGRGLALIGNSSLALRDAGIHVEIECSPRGSVCSVRLSRDGREDRLDAWGRIPRRDRELRV